MHVSLGGLTYYVRVLVAGSTRLVAHGLLRCSRVSIHEYTHVKRLPTLQCENGVGACYQLVGLTIATVAFCNIKGPWNCRETYYKGSRNCRETYYKGPRNCRETY